MAFYGAAAVCQWIRGQGVSDGFVRVNASLVVDVSAGQTCCAGRVCLAADVARKHDPQLADLYRRMIVERGRHHNQALCAVVTHLTGRIYALLRENRT